MGNYTVSQYSLRMVKEKSVSFPSQGAQICKPKQAVVVAERYIGDQVTEHALVVSVNNKNEVIGVYIVAIGSGNQCLIKMCDIARAVLLSGASMFFFAHNHPSGTCDPSLEDVHITSEILSMCRLLDLTLLDHVIVSTPGTKHFSFREQHGYLWDSK